MPSGAFWAVFAADGTYFAPPAAVFSTACSALTARIGPYSCGRAVEWALTARVGPFSYGRAVKPGRTAQIGVSWCYTDAKHAVIARIGPYLCGLGVSWALIGHYSCLLGERMSHEFAEGLFSVLSFMAH